MILFLTATLAEAAPDALVTHLKSRSYKVKGNVLVVSQEKELLDPLKKSDLPHEVLPKMGDINKEVARLQNKHGTPCVLQLRTPKADTDVTDNTDAVDATVSKVDNTNSTNIDTSDENTLPHVYTVANLENIEIVEMGRCTIDDTMRYRLKDNGPYWTVVDNQDNEISVEAFANVCEDLPLLLRLDLEEQISYRNGKVLEWGATALAIGGLFTLGNPDPGFSAREQNTFWTGVFLFGTASMLYTQRDAPFVYKTDRQSDLSNYHSREEVERILLKTFGEDVIEEEIDSTPEGLQGSTPNENADSNENPDSDKTSPQDRDSQSTDAPIGEAVPVEITTDTPLNPTTESTSEELSESETTQDSKATEQEEANENSKPINSEVTP